MSGRVLAGEKERGVGDGEVRRVLPAAGGGRAGENCGRLPQFERALGTRWQSGAGWGYLRVAELTPTDVSFEPEPVP
ncbi:hypothetical protein RUM44_006399 [Polyplax serrata]|uniref:Uncharacterized protein n=1 Tax=Polyplax serrata TaxID=468196 RepID=A0ABR1AI05_POLSC